MARTQEEKDGLYEIWYKKYYALMSPRNKNTFDKADYEYRWNMLYRENLKERKGSSTSVTNIKSSKIETILQNLTDIANDNLKCSLEFLEDLCLKLEEVIVVMRTNIQNKKGLMKKQLDEEEIILMQKLEELRKRKEAL